MLLTSGSYSPVLSEVEADGVMAEQNHGRLVEKASRSLLDPLFLAAHPVAQSSFVRLSNELGIVRSRLV